MEIFILESRKQDSNLATTGTDGAMRIAQVAPLYESVPPKQYGGTERVVSALSDELVALGHEVTLFASGDSETKARLVSAVDTSLRKRMSRDEMIQIAPLMHHRMLAELSAISTEFDVIHSHVDHLAFPYSTLWRSRRCVPW